MIKFNTFLLVSFMISILFFTQSKADFRLLSEEEYYKLRKEEAAQYLVDLENAFNDAKARETAAQNKIAEEKRKIDNLKSKFEIAELDKSLGSVEGKYNALMKEINYF